MEDLSLHILDVAENAVRANAQKVAIRIREEKNKHLLTLYIEDDGDGMDEETVEKALNPFFTTKEGKKTGLGLSLLAQAAQQTEGSFKVDSKQGQGTKITAVFKRDHPDMKPVGDVLQTIATLVTGYPQIQFIYDYQREDYKYHFDSQED